MSAISRRTLLVSSGSAVIASTIAGTAGAGLCRSQEPSRDLRALIDAHEAIYAAFGKAIRDPDSKSRDHDIVSRAEEKALLAVCSYPAASEADRRAKAKYLLEVQARGELDLEEHIQAVLRSTMWRA